MYPYVHCSIIYKSQDKEAVVDVWIKMKGACVCVCVCVCVYIHIYTRILLSHKKELNNAICSNMDGPRDCYTKWSKSDSERQIPYDITYMWNLKKWHELIYKTETDSQM